MEALLRSFDPGNLLTDSQSELSDSSMASPTSPLSLAVAGPASASDAAVPGRPRTRNTSRLSNVSSTGETVEGEVMILWPLVSPAHAACSQCALDSPNQVRGDLSGLISF